MRHKPSGNEISESHGHRENAVPARNGLESEHLNEPFTFMAFNL